MRKKLVIIVVIILIILFILGSLFMIRKSKGNDSQNSEKKLIQEQQQSSNNEITSITISDNILYESEEAQVFTLNQEEVYIVFNILENLNFKKERCDGIANYSIKVNSKNDENIKYFSLEIYSEECHILTKDGEAVLTEEQSNEINRIINKYFNK